MKGAIFNLHEQSRYSGWLRARDRGVGVRVPVGSNILTWPIPQIGSGVHPASYPMDTGAKRLGSEAHHSSADFKET
jgi:hypothetical protein